VSHVSGIHDSKAGALRNFLNENTPFAARSGESTIYPLVVMFSRQTMEHLDAA